MKQKFCKWCNTSRPLKDFYRHPMMADGHLNKCKFCQRENIKMNYRRHLEARKDYERERGQTPHRKERVLIYQRRRRRKYPEKNKARRMVAYYVRVGKLVKSVCSVCGDKKVEAHHPDYSKPLEIEWLCHFHHRQKEGRLI